MCEIRTRRMWYREEQLLIRHRKRFASFHKVMVIRVKVWVNEKSLCQWLKIIFVRFAIVFCLILLYFYIFFVPFHTLTRHISSNEEPGYAAVDQQGRVMGPRVLPQGAPTTSAPRNGPLDPTVPYAIPQKKKSSKKPGREPSEPAIGKPHLSGFVSPKQTFSSLFFKLKAQSSFIVRLNLPRS